MPPSEPQSNLQNIELIQTLASINETLKSGQVSIGNNPCKFRVYKVAAQNATNANPVVQFDGKTFDTGGNVDITTNKGRFTAPFTGFYQINAAVSIAAGGAEIMAIQIGKNGAQLAIGNVMYWTSPGAATWTGLFSDVLFLAQGDYIEVQAYSVNTRAISAGTQQSYFSGFLITRQ